VAAVRNSAAVRGRFVAVEGCESVGKSTQVAKLGFRSGVVRTFEPGDTKVGKTLRELLLNPASGKLCAEAEALLMAADRAQHVADVIRPELEAGRHVVCDRYIGSSLAYQGFGRGLDVERVRELSDFATGGLWPDLIILLDMDPRHASGRSAQRADRFESQGENFHQRIRNGYLQLAREDPQRWVIVDADRSVEAVTSAIDEIVADRLGW